MTNIDYTYKHTGHWSVYKHVIHKCKNITLQDYSRILVILTILSTFSVRLPFSTIQACFQKDVIFVVSMTISSTYSAVCWDLLLFTLVSFNIKFRGQHKEAETNTYHHWLHVYVKYSWSTNKKKIKLRMLCK